MSLTSPRGRGAVVAGFFLLACAGPPGPSNHGNPIPAISGIAPLGGADWLVVHDARGDAAADLATDRLGICTLGADGRVAYAPLPLDVRAEWLPRDLEAVAADPRARDTFLALESGGADGPRRLFALRVTGAGAGRRAVLTATPVDLRPWTQSLVNVEGMLALPEGGDRVRLVVADRTNAADASAPATIAMVAVAMHAGAVTSAEPWGIARLPRALPSDWRSCSDLALGADGSVFASSCRDPGPGGPFESIVSRIGTVRGGAFSAAVGAGLTVPGHKVEGITRDAGSAGGLLLATDDEMAGGVVRRVDAPVEPGARGP